jgi:hypothetical protein
MHLTPIPMQSPPMKMQSDPISMHSDPMKIESRRISIRSQCLRAGSGGDFLVNHTNGTSWLVQ